MNGEPLINVASVTAIGTALLGLVVAFAVPLSDGQQAAVLGVVGALAPLVVAAVARPKVTPVRRGQRRRTAAEVDPRRPDNPHRNQAGAVSGDMVLAVFLGATAAGIGLWLLGLLVGRV